MKIGIDLGGSHVGVGLIDENYHIKAKKEENLSKEEKGQIESSIIEKIQENIEKLLEENGLTIDQIEQIGIACPGTISNGEIIKARKFRTIPFSITAKITRNMA